MASGMNMRPTTRDEVRTHLESFGLIGDVIDNKVRRLSGGQVSIALQHDGSRISLSVSISAHDASSNPWPTLTVACCTNDNSVPDWC